MTKIVKTPGLSILLYGLTYDEAKILRCRMRAATALSGHRGAWQYLLPLLEQDQYWKQTEGIEVRSVRHTNQERKKIS